MNNEAYIDLNSQEVNGIQLWSQYQNELNINNEKGNYKNLFKGKTRNITIILSMCWFCNSFVYYGITFVLPLSLEIL